MILCKIGWHVWGKWEIISRGIIEDYENHPKGTYIEQQRICVDCGLTQTKISSSR